MRDDIRVANWTRTRVPDARHLWKSQPPPANPRRGVH